MNAIALRVFIGYDSHQPIAYHVCAHSVWRHATHAIAITQLNLATLPITRRGLTEFTYSRFLTPWLSDFTGYSLFLDSDMLCRADVCELLAYAVAYPETTVFIVEHKIAFERPSLMLFNNAKCRVLTPQFVENSANRLFDFAWTSSITPIVGEWNHLVDYDPQNAKAKIAHFTKGIPVWNETQHFEFAKEWRDELRIMNSTCSFAELMGPSRHVIAR
jgi:hypothetical protein